MSQNAASPINPHDVSCWVFDLDNTLYPGASNFFAQVSARMTTFIQAEFDLDKDAARQLQKEMFQKHGTTMCGLMVEHDIDAHKFLRYVHDIDLTTLPPNPNLNALLTKLPGRKIIYTNGSEDHANNIMKRIGIDHHFDFIFDIIAADFDPKPSRKPFDKLIEDQSIEPETSVMVEDMAVNLQPAAALGMTTVWLRHDRDWAKRGSDQDFVHHAIDDLEDWITSVVDRV